MRRLLPFVLLTWAACPAIHPTPDTDGDGDPDVSDCADADPLIHTIDQDADGLSPCSGDCDDADPMLDLRDEDGDGWTSCGGDCRPEDVAIHPEAQELCDGFDTDCNGLLSWEESIDQDEDGRGRCADCDDQDPAVWSGIPGAADTFGDGVDGDCDGVDGTDGDGDGYPGNAPAEAPEYDCEDGDPTLGPWDDDGDGYSRCGGDCDDGDPTRNPGEEELCDGIDSDCLATASDTDDDMDGARPCDGDCDDFDPFANPGDFDGDGYSTCDGDCEPWDPGCFPGNPEVCDGVDQDCVPDPLDLDLDWDGTAQCFPDCDDGDPTLNEQDGDGDGWSSCAGDCDDASATTWPGAWEPTGDGVDGDCDGEDEGSLGNSVLIVGRDSTDFVGEAHGTGGDIDGDGYDDLLVPAASEHFGPWTSEVAVFRGGLGTTAGTTLTLDDAFATLIGAGGWDYLTFATSIVPDLDGDGLDEVAVGSPGSSRGATLAGAVWVVSGATLTAGSVVVAPDSPMAVLGATAYEASGNSLEPTPDVDGDGVADLWVGAPGFGAGVGDWGRAYLMSGAQLVTEGNVSVSDALATFTPPIANGHAGTDIAALGDVDGDGIPEVAISAENPTFATNQRGRVYVLLGSTAAAGGALTGADAQLILQGSQNQDHLGQSIAATGDADGDGLGELAASGSSSGVHWIPGSEILLGGSVIDVSTLPGIQCPAGLLHVGPSGDVDGDGFADLVLGSAIYGQSVGSGPSTTFQGLAAVVSGSGWNPALAPSATVFGAGFAWMGLSAADGVGDEPSAILDFDGDGAIDVIVGASTANPGGVNNAGQLHILLHPN